MNDVVQIVNAVSVVILVGVTGYYAWTTRKILDESAKMRRAAEQQAASAMSQAAAAKGSLTILQQQIEELVGLGESVIKTTIDTAVRGIEDWKKLDIKNNLATAELFPSPHGLVPDSAQAAIEHARRVSEECVDLLVGAFADLRSAQKHIEMLRGFNTRTLAATYFNPAKYDPNPFLTDAFAKLQKARMLVS